MKVIVYYQGIFAECRNSKTTEIIAYSKQKFEDAELSSLHIYKSGHACRTARKKIQQ
jgi:hypothetical protein